MTYLLETQNHGKIEAGYFGPFVEHVRFNDPKFSFTLRTPDFVSVVTGFARGNYRWLIDIVEDKNTWARMVYDPQSKIVSLGYCDIPVEEFGYFADYVFHGGFCGWGSDKPAHWRPDFVVEAREKVRKNLMLRKRETKYLQHAQQKELPRLEDVLRERK